MDWSSLITPVFFHWPSGRLPRGFHQEIPALEAFDELFSEEEPPSNSSHAFIVRIWSDTPDPNEAAPSWRGSIQVVGSAQRLYFYDLGAIRRFIAENLPVPASRPPTLRQTLSRAWLALLQKLNLDD